MGGLDTFLNLECVVLDPTYCAYMQCELKPMSRGIVALNVHANLLRGPFKNAKVFPLMLLVIHKNQK